LRRRGATVSVRTIDVSHTSNRRGNETLADYDLTLSRAAIPELLEQPAALGKLVETILNQVLEAQMREHLGADRYERIEEREGYRNGFRERQLATRVGPLTLRVPQTHDGSFSTDIFERYRRSEQAFVLGLMEMVVNGVIDAQGHAYYGSVMRYVVFGIMDFPRAHRKQIASTNPLERLNAEIKRRTNVVGIFPNDAAIVRLVGALLLEQNDEWQLQRRYLSLEGLGAVSDNQNQRLSAVVTG
jgi:transposase-like protein